MAAALRKSGPSSDEIYEDLCRKIEMLEYMPGTGISENELCTNYGVTRHVIRNAIAGLKQRKLIEVYPQRGTYVSLIDMKYVENILYLRESVEQEALARIMKLDNTEKLESDLYEILDEQKKIPLEVKEHDRFYQVDNQFHIRLLEEVGEKNVMELIAEHYIHVRRWRNFEIRTSDRMQEILQEHESVIQAIHEKNPVKGRESLHHHLDTVERYSKTLQDVEGKYFVQEEEA